MGTIILAGLIFIAVIAVIYQYGIKKKSTCDCSNVDCPVKKNTSKSQKELKSWVKKD